MNTILKRRKAKQKRFATLNLTSLMDIFTILVFFLLVSAQNPTQLPTLKNVELPRSTSDKPMVEALNLVIEPTRILINDQPVMTLHVDPLQNDYTPLAISLATARDQYQPTPSANGAPDRDVMLYGDKTVPFAVLRQIMRICGEQQFGRISFGTNREKAHAS